MLGEEAGKSGIVDKTLAMLADLKHTPAGGVIYDQIALISSEHEQLRVRVDQTYGVMLHLLLGAYAQNPTPESVFRLTTQLIQLRGAIVGSVPPDAAAPVIADTAASPAAATPNDESNATTLASSAPAATEESADSAEPTGDTDASGVALQTERRVNTAYRLHLDRKRDEIEKLQETLSQSIREAIAQNREFGAMLKIEMGALKQANDGQEVETLRQILIGGVEELINGHHLLDSKLNQTSGYLNLIKADSQRLRDELHKVRLLSLTDEFTGLPNRRAFMRRLGDEIGRAQRYLTPLALVLIDLDEFKGINDAYGHGGGDEVLRCYASQVLSILRHHDMVARYGGEEFALMLPNTTEHGAVAAMVKARERAHDVFCQFGTHRIRLPTFSAGVAMYQPLESSTDLIERADRALYRAKSLGRNRVEIAPATPPTVAPGPTAVDAEAAETNPQEII